MNANRRRANLRMDQLRRALHRGQGGIYQRRHWESLIRADREPRPFRPLGDLSWLVRLNLDGCDGSRRTDAYVRDHMRRTLAAVRAHQSVPIF